MSDIRDMFLKEPSGENEFERKHAAKQILEEQRSISPKPVFFDSVYSVDISEYNFGKQEFKVGFGVKKGTTGGEVIGIPNSPDVLQIANDKGQRFEFHLKMNEKDAELFDKEQKEHVNLFVVYKFVKGVKFKYWNPLKAAAMRESGLRGDHGDEEDARIYIKPICVALESGSKVIPLYETRDKN